MRETFGYETESLELLPEWEMGPWEADTEFADEMGFLDQEFAEPGELFEFGLEGEAGGAGGGVALTGAALNLAVQRNRVFARQLGWGCVVGGQVRHVIRQVRALLGLGPNPSEAALAQAIARWQPTALGGRGDGQLSPRAWQRMLATLRASKALPTPNFKAESQWVTFGGRRLGVIEKTDAYRKCYFDPTSGAACRPNRSGIANEGGGAEIELGFRVTDMDAVRRAGFVDRSGEDRFRWIQVVEFITVPSNRPSPAPPFIRRASRVIDPTALVDPPSTLDPHPYYWDEVTPVNPPGTPQASDAVHIRHFLNRPARNGLCYDLIFFDRPRFPLSVAQPGRRAYFNFELALVGVRAGTPIRNVLLNTYRWGYDLVVERGVTNVRMNVLSAGPYGGSPAFRRVVNQALNATPRQFPGHCFVGADFTGSARCP
jgi:hypothetical protein